MFNKNNLLLYAITSRSNLGEKTLLQAVEESLKGGVTILQLREKDIKGEDIRKEAKKIRDLCKKYEVPFIINDDVKLALEIDADGVHLGLNDMDISEARKILGKDKIIGASAHNPKEARLAESLGASYLGVGAVFGTYTKNDATKISIETLSETVKAVSIPVVAIGGISYDNLDELKDTNISGVAVISAIYGEDDIEEKTAALYKKVNKYFVK